MKKIYANQKEKSRAYYMRHKIVIQERDRARSKAETKDPALREKRRVYVKQYFDSHPHAKELHLIRQRKSRDKLREETMLRYGGNPPRCQCCQESTRQFLAIDHINGGGCKHRKQLGSFGVNFYAWLRRNGWPDGYQVLCHNCNLAKGYYGACPHQQSN